MIRNLKRENIYYSALNKDIYKGSIFLESSQGGKLNGEIFYALVEIIKKHKHFKVFLSLNNKKDLNSFVLMNRKKINIIKRGSKKYWDALARCEFLISDTTFPPFFIKRKDQIYVNTWHGTPLKTLGIDEKKPTNISNIQKNFLLSDFILTNNNWNKKVYEDSYMIKNLISNKILIRPSLRNNVNLLSKDTDLRNQNQVEKTIVLFTYTWNSEQLKDLTKLKSKLLYIDKEIDRMSNKNDFLFLYSIHYMIDGNELKRFFNKKLKNLELLSQDKEINEEIFKSSIVITDFSSSMFDASLLGKRVILDFTELNTYNKTRGLYNEVYNDLVFERVFHIHEIFTLINKPSNIRRMDLNKFNNKYSLANLKRFSYNTSDTWIDELLSYSLKKETNFSNLKENILIYPGNLSNNGITSSFFPFLEKLLAKDINVIIWLPKAHIGQNRSFNLYKNYSKIYQNLNIIHSNKIFSQSKINKLVIGSNFFFKRKFLFKNKFNEIMHNEAKKIFGDIKFSKVIHFSGYESFVFSIFNFIKNVDERIAFVHNDMTKEWKNKRNFNYKILKDSYNNFDKLIFVSKILMETVKGDDIYNSNNEKFYFINNLIPKKILNYSNLKNDKLVFLNKDIDKNLFYSKINNPNIIKFLTIGRISNEKNQLFTLKAFSKFCKLTERDSLLLFVGSYSSKGSTLLKIKIKIWTFFSKNKDNIIFIKLLNNPSYLYSKSDLLLLPSKHEGFPMVTLEAAYHGLNSLTSDLPGLIEQKVKYNINKLSILNLDNFVDNMDNAKNKTLKFNYKDYEIDVISQIDFAIWNK